MQSAAPESPKVPVRLMHFPEDDSTYTLMLIDSVNSLSQDGMYNESRYAYLHEIIDVSPIVMQRGPMMISVIKPGRYEDSGYQFVFLHCIFDQLTIAVFLRDYGELLMLMDQTDRLMAFSRIPGFERN